MEYLMTYGWAILIIAIVVGVLYYLGVFSSANLAPRAQPGSCQVFRPNGPGTSYDAGLSGTCQGELPEYVAQFNGASQIQISNFNIGNNVTIAAWLMSSSYGASPGQIPLSLQGNNYGSGPNVFFVGAVISWNTGDGISDSFSSSSYPNSNWHSLVVVDNPSTNLATLYIDGVSIGTATYKNPTTTSRLFSIGCFNTAEGGGYCVNGMIADVQIYNTSLSPNEVTALYDEGIGGAPIKPQSIVGWWPLNGNPNDYSGNLNQGTATSVTYTSSWTSGYTAP